MTITLDELGQLPVVLTSAELATGILRCDVDHLYDLNRRGELPFEPLTLGRKLMWPTARVLSALDIEWPVLAAERAVESEEPPAALQVIRATGAQSS